MQQFLLGLDVVVRGLILENSWQKLWPSEDDKTKKSYSISLDFLKGSKISLTLNKHQR